MNHPRKGQELGDEDRGERRERLIRERRVEVFLQLERCRERHAPPPREQAMRGTAFKAFYYFLATLFFILYGALI